MTDLREPVFIGLGANLPSDQGDLRATLQAALTALSALSNEPPRCSSFWESEPVDCPPGSPRYVNAVCLIFPPEGESPQSLLHNLQSIEYRFGRRRSGTVNEPRVLDLDLLAWGERRLETQALTLPHPRAHQRAFVLAPWAELAPQFSLVALEGAVSRKVGELLLDVDQSTLRKL